MGSSLGAVVRLLSGWGLVVMAGGALAQANPDDGSLFAGARISLSESVWLATWEPVLEDIQVVIPQQSTTPVAQSRFAAANPATRPLYITALSFNKGPWVVTASTSTTARYAHPLSPNGNIARREADASIGYVLSPNVVASIIYKWGKVSQGASIAAANLAGPAGAYQLNGFGAGLTFSAPLSFGSDAGKPPRLRAYGSFALAAGHAQLTGVRYGIDYRISEIGLLYNLGSVGQAGTLTAKIGYRSQIVNEKGLDEGTYSIVPPYNQIANQKTDYRSTTDGFILGLTVTF